MRQIKIYGIIVETEKTPYPGEIPATKVASFLYAC